MALATTHRRAPGTGSVILRCDSAGRETWYGKWRIDGHQVKRRLGPKRLVGTREGLTRTQAEAELRRLMAEVRVSGPVTERMSIEELGRRYVADLERRGRKKTTVLAVRSALDIHLVPFFADKSVGSIRPADVDDLIAMFEQRKLSPKSIRNYAGTLSALFRYASAPRRRWATSNPCDGVELPGRETVTEIRFLELDEVEALVDGAQPGSYHQVDRGLYLTAAMTGLRQGELVALRWRDVDWKAGRVRVRQTYSGRTGEYTTPKSRRSTRSVPLSDRVAAELDLVFKASRYQSDDDLVFADPIAGGPLQVAAVLRRYRRALKAAQLEETRRFHDLRHTFGTRMAAAGVPMRTLQEWMGHRDVATTQIYADYAPSPHERELVEAAFSMPTPPVASEQTVV
jgi:integrase